MNDEYYALKKLCECSRSLYSIINEMAHKRKGIEKHREKNDLPKAKELYKELLAYHKRLIETIADTRLLLLETEQDSAASYSGSLLGAVKKFNLMTSDYTKFGSAVNVLIEQLPKTDGTTNAGIIGRLMNMVKLGYYPTDIHHIGIIKKAIAFPDIKVNLFDPCCGCGLALAELSSGQNTDTFGVEIDDFRCVEAQSRLDRVAFGSYFSSRINHEAFHLMLLNPPYLSVMTQSGGNARHEKRFLIDSICHLMLGGLIIYIIPYYRLTADICRVLCDNFSNLSVYRFADKEFSKFKQIAVLGTRQKKINGSSHVDELLKYALNPDNIPPLDALTEGLYSLPQTEKRVDIFKGAKFNVKELEEQLKKSKSIAGLFEKSKLDDTTKNPLLPLNLGKIGLIGGSGLINGLVNCETPHIIKGRIIKEIKQDASEITDENGRVISSEIRVTRVNRMIFNLLTPDGFRSLA